MEKYSSIFPFHETGPKCEQTSHNQAVRYLVILYCHQSPTIVSDIILSNHLSLFAIKRISLKSLNSFFFCTVEFEYIPVFY